MRLGHIRQRSGGWCYVIDTAPRGARRRQRWRSGFRSPQDAAEAMERDLTLAAEEARREERRRARLAETRREKAEIKAAAERARVAAERAAARQKIATAEEALTLTLRAAQAADKARSGLPPHVRSELSAALDCLYGAEDAIKRALGSLHGERKP